MEWEKAFVNCIAGRELIYENMCVVSTQSNIPIKNGQDN